MIGRNYPVNSAYHKQNAANSNLNLWQSWLYQRQIGRRAPLGFRDRQHKDTYRAIVPVSAWDQAKSSSPHGAIFNLEFSPDGRMLVAACEKKSFLVFDPLSGRLINHVERAHNDCVNCIRFLDSRVFATCSDDMTVGLWDIRFLKHRIRSLRGHSNWVKNIEYASNAHLLVSSGFDGSVFVWDINRYTDDVQFRQVFHINGLMRTKLTPDESKLIMCTSAGYMVVINNLDLTTLPTDLNAFNPNMYRLMQLTDTPNNNECRFNRLFTAKRNRVEFVCDFPTGNSAEIISSLQVHPQGWCLLSRNASNDKMSEWTCIHDIQDIKVPIFDEGRNDQDESMMSSPLPSVPTVSSSQQGSPSTTDAPTAPGQDNATGSRPVLHFHFRYRNLRDGVGSDSPRQNPNENDDENDETSMPELDVEVRLTTAEVVDLMAPSGRTIEVRGSQLASALSVARTRLAAQADERDGGRERGRRDLNGIGGELPNFGDRPSVLLEAMSQLVTYSVESLQGTAERTLANAASGSTPAGTTVVDGKSSSSAASSSGSTHLRIHRNHPRLTHFCEELNVGRGFIKELCFSTDGRLICSPFGHGVRLLAFDSECRELCDSVPLQPQGLHEISSNVGHKHVVVCTKYSPTHPLLVSGCLGGKVCFHQPALT